MEVLTRLKERGFEAYLVGGCVRDMVRGKPPKDFDLATSARPEEVQASFRKTIPTGIEHGTVTVLQRGTPVEVTTFRTEGEYLDSRRPSSVAFHTDIAQDLSRRDFTINAMAWDPTDGPEGRLVDPFGGRKDLKARVIRCVGTAHDRFSEDGLRALRAVRFAAVLGFELDGETEQAIPATLPSFRRIAPERIREELNKLLLSDRPREGLLLLRRTGLLGTFLPELAPPSTGDEDFAFLAEATGRTPAELEQRLAVLLHRANPKQILLRLRSPTRTIETTSALVRALSGFDPEVARSDADLRRFLARLTPALAEPFLAVIAGLRGGEATGAFAERLRAIVAERPPLDAKALALNGNRIMEVLGVGPSRVVGEATRFLVDEVLEDPEVNTPEALEARLRAWSRGSSRGG